MTVLAETARKSDKESGEAEFARMQQVGRRTLHSVGPCKMGERVQKTQQAQWLPKIQKTQESLHCSIYRTGFSRISRGARCVIEWQMQELANSQLAKELGEAKAEQRTNFFEADGRVRAVEATLQTLMKEGAGGLGLGTVDWPSLLKQAEERKEAELVSLKTQLEQAWLKITELERGRDAVSQSVVDGLRL